MESRLEKLASLVYTVQEGEKRLDKVGHTLLQKLFYLLQHGEGAELGYKYKLYYYGPYCQDLWADLHVLDGQGAITVEATPGGFGYRIGVGANAEAVDYLQQFVDATTREKVGKLLDLLGEEPVKSLESLATTHYVYVDLRRRVRDCEKEMVVQKVRDLKPHLKASEISRAIETLEENGLVN